MSLNHAKSSSLVYLRRMSPNGFSMKIPAIVLPSDPQVKERIDHVIQIEEMNMKLPNRTITRAKPALSYLPARPAENGTSVKSDPARAAPNQRKGLNDF